ncbi:MAG: asparagine synthase (glutamine-hydrolyzing), partial [Rhodospirillales bacterium]|nr:asparagine synthase (glutamine-hydrolyzing) [Rhodospirillales bacterium]
DLEHGRQPMSNETGSVVVIFNGEIYNHRELRRDLESRGHVFKTHHCDTEILVHGFEEWGTGLPLRLNGMFAFAIVDLDQRTLFLARDRFGEKPLYYADMGGVFMFASELTALLAHPSFTAEPDVRSLQKLFAYSFLPAPNTIYKSCRKLPHGSWLLRNLVDGGETREQYWRFRIEPEESKVPERQLASELRDRLKESVRQRLLSDVPLGIFLSGGIDSSAVAALACELHGPKNVLTFSLGFEDPSFDESNYARMAAEHLGTRHFERKLSLDRELATLPRVLAQLDEPQGDPSFFPTYLLSSFTREQVTVALGGDGGDELFAGYDPFAALKPAALYRKLVPSALHGGLRGLAGRLPLSGKNMSLDFKLKKALSALSLPTEFWNPVWMGCLEADDIAGLLGQPADPEDIYSEAISYWRTSAAASPVDRTLEFFTNFYFPEVILSKVDRASMLNALEVRSPFLDNDLVDFVRRLPHGMKFKNGRRKHILKQAFAGVLPDAILNRPKKGFGMPLVKWLGSMTTPDAGPFRDLFNPDWTAGHQAISAHGRDYRQYQWLMQVLGHYQGRAGGMVSAEEKHPNG